MFILIEKKKKNEVKTINIVLHIIIFLFSISLTWFVYERAGDAIGWREWTAETASIRSLH